MKIQFESSSQNEIIPSIMSIDYPICSGQLTSLHSYWFFSKTLWSSKKRGISLIQKILHIIHITTELLISLHLNIHLKNVICYRYFTNWVIWTGKTKTERWFFQNQEQETTIALWWVVKYTLLHHLHRPLKRRLMLLRKRNWHVSRGLHKWKKKSRNHWERLACWILNDCNDFITLYVIVLLSEIRVQYMINVYNIHNITIIVVYKFHSILEVSWNHGALTNKIK